MLLEAANTYVQGPWAYKQIEGGHELTSVLRAESMYRYAAYMPVCRPERRWLIEGNSAYQGWMSTVVTHCLIEGNGTYQVGRMSAIVPHAD